MIAVAVTFALATPIQAPPPALPGIAIPARAAVPSAVGPAPVLALAGSEPALPAGERTAPTTVIVPDAAPGQSVRTPGDPHEKFNRRMFARYQKLDRGFLRPVALGYKHAVPRPVRSGIRHFFSNLGEPVVFLNFLLQGKPGKAFETLGRFVINSTVGIGGLIDVAKASGLPHRPNGFADTLGFYGVKPGAYLFLPLVGPTTIRDLFGGQVVDGSVLPLAVGKPFNKLYYQVPHAVLTGLDQRAQSEGDLRALLDGAVDPYATLRSVYLQDRAAEIAALHGRSRQSQSVPANDNLADPLVDPLTDPAAQIAPSSGGGEMADPLDDPATTPASSPVAAPAAPARR